MDAVKKLTEENSKEHEALRLQTAKADKKAELVLEAQRALNSKHDALRAEHGAFCVSMRQEVESMLAGFVKDLQGTAEKLEVSITSVKDALEARTAKLETQFQVSMWNLNLRAMRGWLGFESVERSYFT